MLRKEGEGLREERWSSLAKCISHSASSQHSTQDTRRDARRNQDNSIYEEVDLDDLMDDDQRVAKNLPPKPGVCEVCM